MNSIDTKIQIPVVKQDYKANRIKMFSRNNMVMLFSMNSGLQVWKYKNTSDRICLKNLTRIAIILMDIIG